MTEQHHLHLPDPYLRMVQATLRQHAPDALVWAYGSRVRGDHHEASDLDLVLRDPGRPQFEPGQLARLRKAFSDSNLPIVVQVVEWSRIPGAFQAEISAMYAVVQAQPDAEERTHSV